MHGARVPGVSKKIEDDPTAAVLLAGDLLNNGVKSSKTDVYKEKSTRPPDIQKEMMIDLLEPIKDKIVAGSCRETCCTDAEGIVQ